MLCLPVSAPVYHPYPQAPPFSWGPLASPAPHAVPLTWFQDSAYVGQHVILQVTLQCCMIHVVCYEYISHMRGLMALFHRTNTDLSMCYLQGSWHMPASNRNLWLHQPATAWHLKVYLLPVHLHWC